MSSNTKLRVYSAIGIVALISLCLALGPDVTILFIFFIGFLINDEILTNFLTVNRQEVDYKFSQIFYLILVAIFISLKNGNLSFLLLGLNLIQNALLLIVLFSKDKKHLSYFKALGKQKFFIGFLVFLPIHSIAFIVTRFPENWLMGLVGLSLLVASTDTMGWFVGRSFGKNKLMPSVSPKKTIEGAIGSIVGATVIMGIFWYYLFEQNVFKNILIFSSLAIFSILGDLVQSKLKRTFKIKDSSSLIPGHGGIYDRTDSVLYIAPLYCLLLLSLL